MQHLELSNPEIEVKYLIEEMGRKRTDGMGEQNAMATHRTN